MRLTIVMASQEESKQQRYKKTPKGKETQAKAVAKYQKSSKGQEALTKARAKHESSEARKAYKREWMRRRREQQKASLEISDRTQDS